MGQWPISHSNFQIMQYIICSLSSLAKKSAHMTQVQHRTFVICENSIWSEAIKMGIHINHAKTTTDSAHLYFKRYNIRLLRPIWLFNILQICTDLYILPDVLTRAATFTRVTEPFRVSAINVYKIVLPFTRTLARDQHRCLLIAFPNKKYSLKQ